jgi:hypothetical protein
MGGARFEHDCDDCQFLAVIAELRYQRLEGAGNRRVLVRLDLVWALDARSPSSYWSATSRSATTPGDSPSGELTVGLNAAARPPNAATASAAITSSPSVFDSPI